MKQKSFPCRFPGCEIVYDLPQHRGRHESQRHGMVKGDMPASSKTVIATAPNGATSLLPRDFGSMDVCEVVETGRIETNGAPLVGQPFVPPSSFIHLALEQLAAQSAQIERERAVLDDALRRLCGAAPGK